MLFRLRSGYRVTRPSAVNATFSDMVHRMKFVCGVGPTGWPSLTAHIDGQSLSALAEAYERTRGYTDPAGGYGGFELIHVTIRSDGLHFVGCDHPKSRPKRSGFLRWPVNVGIPAAGLSRSGCALLARR